MVPGPPELSEGEALSPGIKAKGIFVSETGNKEAAL